MKILGIDPGLRVTGFGLIEQTSGTLRYIASGTIKSGEHELPRRLQIILRGVIDVIDQFGADCSAIEKVFVNVNPQSTLLLGQARGAAICGLVSRDISVQEYTALQIKKSVTGHGKAQKSQVQEMVQRFLALPMLPGTDAADALAVAICHAHSHQAIARLQKTGAISTTKGMRMRGGRLIG